MVVASLAYGYDGDGTFGRVGDRLNDWYTCICISIIKHVMLVMYMGINDDFYLADSENCGCHTILIKH